MNVETIFLLRDRPLSALLEKWFSESSLNYSFFDSKSDVEHIQGMVILTEGLDVDRPDQEYLIAFEGRRVPVRKVDLNGTLQVAVSGLDLWLKNNKCSTILVTGSDAVQQNENLIRFLERTKDLIRS